MILIILIIGVFFGKIEALNNRFFINTINNVIFELFIKDRTGEIVEINFQFGPKNFYEFFLQRFSLKNDEITAILISNGLQNIFKFGLKEICKSDKFEYQFVKIQLLFKTDVSIKCNNNSELILGKFVPSETNEVKKPEFPLMTGELVDLDYYNSNTKECFIKNIIINSESYRIKTCTKIGSTENQVNHSTSTTIIINTNISTEAVVRRSSFNPTVLLPLLFVPFTIIIVLIIMIIKSNRKCRTNNVESGSSPPLLESDPNNAGSRNDVLNV